MQSYSTIFIDWAGTLSYSKFWNHWDNASHLDYKTLQQIQKTHFRGDSVKLRGWMRGEYSSEKMIHLFSKETNTDYDYLFHEFIKSCKEMQFSSNEMTEPLLGLKIKILD